MTAGHELFEIPSLALQAGGVLSGARLAYQAYGRLNAARDNCVVVPGYYTGRHWNYRPWMGPGRALDPDHYFIVAPNLFGNGLSSSPSSTAPPHGGADFPRITIHDNVQAQHRLVVEHLGVRRIRLVTGWSMGGVQAYEWAATFPDIVDAILPVCGAARCSPLNFVFLEGVKAALVADGDYAGGRYHRPPERGLRAFGRAYAGWAYSRVFYRDGLYRALGHDSVGALLADWEQDHLGWDANDLLAMLWTWQHADISANPRFGGDFDAALASIRARAILMPGSEDMYFQPGDNAYEAARMPDAELRPIVSAWGHAAGKPGANPPDSAFVEAAMRELLLGRAATAG